MFNNAFEYSKKKTNLSFILIMQKKTRNKISHKDFYEGGHMILGKGKKVHGVVMAHGNLKAR